MAIFLFVLLAVTIFGMQFSAFHKDFMSIRTTTAIKGIFAIVILLSHTSSYLILEANIMDRIFEYIFRYLKQLIVVVYFFYSGYGIMESVLKKNGYIHSFFNKRFLKTLFHFDLAVIIFLVLQFILGNTFDTADYIGCWIGWRSIGNSCWFIFVLLTLYLITYLSFIAWGPQAYSRWFPVITIIIMSAGLWVFLRLVKESYWWYDTLAAYPAGLCFSLLKEKLINIKLEHVFIWFVSTIAIFFVWRHYVGIDIYGICAVIFSFVVVAISLWVKVDNPVLHWLGKHSFSIYILQRIPMITLNHFGIQSEKYVFTTLVIISALILAWGFTKITDMIDSKLFT